ncbi:hypothetical protein GCK72_011158 [Caenorhabditis remanei]|uniref:Uncharacterized protein n=1 Tax=Caenorhabditis remanei TaxID=31234 RepID=A0A6A5H8Z2_CAERE|nr:hypothetical protein GCK72_011157 [Caenorhabditis remanei]XP_053587838.1 hypothetical protein GCK72_011158 [Caenorhabditis remanei]KAF1762893.1 hypothetical protein GCK72_011157 [Caenorhabditis remanei]KAF1762894.1 hypothetical protein GCK72_011158 [Caenorhabditis remanei]
MDLFWNGDCLESHEKASGFSLPHRTYDKLNGHTLMNEIAQQSQSHKNLGLEETKNSIILIMFGLHHGHNVAGDSHCLPKRISDGRSDIQNCDDKLEKKKKKMFYWK